MERDLSAFGYAPGSYYFRCRDCGDVTIAGKRAWRCEPCATIAAGKPQATVVATEAPTLPGLYQVRCMETEGEWEYVAITREMGRLVVHDPHLLEVGLQQYHEGLTDLEWKFIA